MLYKFVGYVCVNKDEFYFIVFDLIDELNMSDFYVVGWLDIDIIGLVLIINDGDWLYKIIVLKYNKFKMYLVEI